MDKSMFVVKDADLIPTRRYIQRKLALEPDWVEPLEAHLSFERLPRDALTLSQWCQQWLDLHQWQRLQAAVRATRHRQKLRLAREGQEPKVHVRLSRTAWSILSELAKRDGLTMSEFIIQQHQPHWLNAISSEEVTDSHP